MDYRLNDVLCGNEKCYLMPFFNMYSEETEASLRNRILEYHNMGMNSILLETYIVEGKTGFEQHIYDDRWWELLKIVSSVCKEYGMDFWIQDTACFPTGSANGWFRKEENHSKNKIYLAERHIDVVGPEQQCAILAEAFLNSRQGPPTSKEEFYDDELFGVVAVKKSQQKDKFVSDSAVVITDQVEDGILYWDIPEGNWRIFFVMKTHNGGRPYFMNLLDRESIHLMIEAVYQPHYEHLREEIGTVWKGFFFDEPELGNVEGNFDILPGSKLGWGGISLPWCDAMTEEMRQRLGAEWPMYLPMLWYPGDEQLTSKVRFDFMDAVTTLVSKNYSHQVYTWCHERGIAYIGHVLEDENSHAHLGCGAGHFFRVQERQDMAGIDVISGQIMPGKDSWAHSWFIMPDADGEFYHYGLMKLASSAAHISPEKKGNALCEAFAVYGTIAGTRLRKFMYDHMAVNGINQVIPAQPGEELKKSAIQEVNRYANKLFHLLKESVHIAPAAVLYHAEAEWSGEAMKFQTVGSRLSKNQIDYDVIPADVFEKRDFYRMALKENSFTVNQEDYKILIIPYCEYIPRSVVRFIEEAESYHIPICFINDYPRSMCEGEELPSAIRRCDVVAADDLAGYLHEKGLFDIVSVKYQPYLRYLHFRRNGLDYYFFHNEEARKNIKTSVTVPSTGKYYKINLLDEKLIELGVSEGNSTSLELDLDCMEAELYVFGLDHAEKSESEKEYKNELVLNREWKVAFCPYTGDYLSLDGLKPVSKPDDIVLKDLKDMGGREMYPRFAGTFIYETDFTYDGCREAVLDLGEVFESAEVWVNEGYAGIRVAPPYQLDISSLCRNGENKLRIEVDNNFTRGCDMTEPEKRFWYTASMYNTLDKSGLLGPVKVLYYSL